MKFIRKNYKAYLVVAVIVLASFFGRVYKLDSLPAILNRDEAALAYTGYLLKETGTDEWGRKWPIAVESFGDFKLIGYPAVLAGLFTIFPSADWVVRLPAAVAGTLLLLVLPLLGRIFFPQLPSVKIWSVFIGATTPVFFFYSRTAFEATVGLLLLLATLILLLNEKNPTARVWRVVATGLCALAAGLTYNTPTLLLPFIALLLPLWYGVKNWKVWLPYSALVIAVVILLVTQLHPLTEQKRNITLFSDPSIQALYPEYRAQFQGVWQTLFGNSVIFYAREIASRSIASFSPAFLVETGGTHPWHQPPGASHLTWPGYLVAFLGISMLAYRSLAAIFRRKLWGTTPWLKSEAGRNSFFLLLLLTSLAPAVVTVDAPHATRSLLFFVLLTLASSWAIALCVKSVRYNLPILHLKLSGLIVVGSIVLVLTAYFAQYQINYWTEYRGVQRYLHKSDLRQIISELNAYLPQLPVGIVDETGYYYIVVAWYDKTPAATFFNTIEKRPKDVIGFSAGQRVSRYNILQNKSETIGQVQVLVEWNDNEQEWVVRKP